MNTRILMILSSLFMAVIGLILSFLPKEILLVIGQIPNPVFTIVLQIAGALYLGFAMLNWMAKGSLLGGIYNRPIMVANFTHFLVAGLALLKAGSGLEASFIWGLAGIYAGFALAFGLTTFTHPKSVNATG